MEQVNYQALALELMAKMQAMHKAMRQKGIREKFQGEDFILQCLCEHGQEALIPKAISNEMGVSAARIAAALNDLEEKGLITRQIDKSDRRKILVKLTKNGRSVAEENRREFLQKIAALLSLVGEHDAKEYVRIMGRIAEEVPRVDL